MYTNDRTRPCCNKQIRNDGREESIAFLGKTQLAATSLCFLPSSRNCENVTAAYRQTNHIWHRKSVEYSHTKSNQIKIKSLLLSHHHSTSALVSEILMSALQTVQKKTTTTIYIWTDSAKKQQQQQFTYGQTVQKKPTTIYIWTDSAKKTTTTIYIWTDSAKKTTNNLHMDRQCKKNNNKQ